MSTHKSFFTLLLGASFLASSGTAAAQSSSAADRREVSITVYNGNFGLVREVRDVAVGTGRVPLEFRDVAATIQPETVHIRSLGGAQSLGVLEQNYRYDLLTPQKLLEKHVGEKVRIHRYNERLGREDSFDARILSFVSGQPVIEMNGEVTYGFPGRFSFPSVPENLMAKPTLVWLLDSKQARQQLEVTYLTQGMNWKADYVLVVNEAETGGALTGWVTLENRSGASYENARLKLVAGDVQRVSAPERPDVRYKAMAAPAPAPTGFREEAFFEYHLYTLQQPTDVRDNEQKQVALLEAKNARIQKKLIFYGQQYWYRGQYGQVQSNQKVGVYLDLKNSQANGLGMPLPKGTVRVYKADKSGSQQFIGEDAIDHTPRDEEVRIKMGEAFDVVGERKQTRWSSLGTCSSESSWEIELRNHKDQATQVEIFEPVGGDWTILEESHPHQRKDANTFTFDVKVPARGKTKVTYRVRTRWC
ncbi:MAG: DUF4139 domain-containing protein [Myxococcales bacterium]|jgi:hypothetical protein|nr:DUF4139 domain-containing protein [Myxococcales bacterium]